MNSQKNKGITLIALVITIIVLLILAGVSLSLVVGEDGIIKRAVNAKKIAEDAEIHEIISLAYQQAVIGQYMNEIDFATSIKKDLENQYGTGNVTVTKNSDGTYLVDIIGKGSYQIDANGNIENVNQKLELGIVTTKEDGNPLEENTRYPKALVTITVTNINEVNISEIKLLDSQNIEMTAKSIDKTAGIATFEVNKNMTYTALAEGKIDGKNTLSQEKVKVNCITLATLDRYKTEGKIEIVWLDEENNIISKPKEPNLQGNMKKLTFDDTTNTFVETTSNNWYAYNSVTSGTNTTSKWANAKTTDGSMWVWIPRYAYKITYYDSDGTTEIGYSCARGIVTVEGDVVAENKEGIDTVGDYIVHPAFTSSAENGGGFGEISGFWFAKFETSGSTTVGTGFKSIAGVESLREPNIAEFYTCARQQLYGENGKTDSLDNYTSFGSSHMVKNSEWGAVAYLSQSSYGTNGVKVQQNISNYITGESSTGVYTDNVNQSTTYNPYGVYDMNGTSWEYVAAYVNNGASNLLNGGDITSTVAQSTKYKTVYPSTVNNGSDVPEADYALNANVRGDAVYETSKSYANAFAWFWAESYFPDSGYPFFGRGGFFYNHNGGVFCFNNGDGTGYNFVTCRLALVF